MGHWSSLQRWTEPINLTLSICIATYNRGSFIGATLDSIICQLTENVEIVVLDGGSTDNTEQVVQLCQKHCPQLRYIRQSTNMGVDRDFARAVDCAKGEYCWLFSDDDLLKPGAIETVLKATRDQYALIIVNAEVLDADLSHILEPDRLRMAANRTYNSNQNHSLLADCGKYMSFIGCVIIRRQLWSTREKEKYFGSYFIHVGVIFQSPLPQDTLVIAKPLISIRYGNAMWLAKYFDIWMFKWPSLIWSLVNYPDSVKTKVCTREPWRNIGRLLLHRAKGTYTMNGYLERLKPRLGSRWARIASKVIAYFPGKIANLLGLIYYSLFSRQSDRQLSLIDLRNSPFYFWRLAERRSSSGGRHATTS
jgi:abequosyltransferase